jgi:hypothetical protein
MPLADGQVDVKVLIYGESGNLLHLHVTRDVAELLGLTQHPGSADLDSPQALVQIATLPPQRTSLTPGALAERWRCPEHHIHVMLDRGVLPYFLTGRKAIRIRLSDVASLEDAEHCRTLSISTRKFVPRHPTTCSVGRVVSL